jgi:hypothetical protein
MNQGAHRYLVERLMAARDRPPPAGYGRPLANSTIASMI